MKRLARLLVVATGLVLALAETILALAILTGTISTAAGGAVHLALIAGAFVLTSRLLPDDRTWPLVLCLSAGAMGPIGAIGGLSCMVLTAYYRRTSTSFEDWYASLFPESEDDESVMLLRRIRANEGDGSRAGGVASFNDILAFGTAVQKQELIAMIVTHFRPAFAPVLRLGLADANNAIRVQAASAVARIEAEFTTRSLAMAARAAASSQPAVLRDLALLHYEYAETGLLEPDRAASSRRTALEAFRKYLKVKPDDAAAYESIGRILLRSGRLEEAADLLEETIRMGYVTPLMVVAYMEALFGLQRFSQLREIGRRHRALLEGLDQKDDGVESAQLWAAEHIHA